MPRDFATPLIASRLRRMLVALMVVAHFATIWGYPLPVLPLAKNAESFPCQHRHCGCQSAHQCWTSCRCMSMQERLDWARRNGVKPPACVTAKVCKVEVITDHAYCGAPRVRRTYVAQTQPRQAIASKSAVPRVVKKEAQKINWVLGIRALQCRGMATHWVTSGAVPLPPQAVEVASIVDLGELLPVARLTLQSISSPPDVPPPRCA